ncbi:GNAT family N-acetyltransferase [Alkalicoccus chagannorensis]|uniref:GNAT family N-acetyltransferase n=1 Tax=Alkalicoccus chagannorensis TaxID=427072 RepID=UPI000412E49A|nr:GNAT family N-acetyltransferase [Alkalicoccus chagannorensis]
MEPTSFTLYLETERLIVRPLENEDFHLWEEGFNERLPAQYKYDSEKLNLSEWTQNMFDEVVLHHRHLAERDEQYVLAVFTKTPFRHIGMVELATILRREFQWGSISYLIHNQFWHHGYGREAVKAGVDIAFQKLDYHRIEAHIAPDNLPSIRLAEDVGLRFECTREHFLYEFDQWNDNSIFFLNAPSVLS